MPPHVNVSIFSSLQKFMLNKENIDKYSFDKRVKHEKKMEKNGNIGKQENSGPIFYPRQKDTLFWCFYIMKYGLDAYNDLNEKDITIVVEKKIKIEWIEILRNKKGILKQNKTAPLTHVENALLNEHKIDVKSFIALCVAEKLPLMYVHNKTYFDLDLDVYLEEEQSKIVVQTDKPLKYGIVLNNDNEYNPQKIRQTHYKIDNINKPLKSISSYKYDELYDICDRLNILQKLDQEKRTTKQVLYEGIVQELGI